MGLTALIVCLLVLCAIQVVAGAYGIRKNLLEPGTTHLTKRGKWILLTAVLAPVFMAVLAINDKIGAQSLKTTVGDIKELVGEANGIQDDMKRQVVGLAAAVRQSKAATEEARDIAANGSALLVDLRVSEYKRYPAFRQGLMCYWLRKHRSYDWLRDAETHFRSEARLEKSPIQMAARYNLALVLAARGKREQALAELLKVPPTALGARGQAWLAVWKGALGRQGVPQDEGCWWAWRLPLSKMPPWSTKEVCER